MNEAKSENEIQDNYEFYIDALGMCVKVKENSMQGPEWMKDYWITFGIKEPCKVNGDQIFMMKRLYQWRETTKLEYETRVTYAIAQKGQ